jgi:hypothetical protein
MNTPKNESSTTPQGEWRPAAPSDSRGPCPALNALANGGHIPHDGVATVAQLVAGIESALGVMPSVGKLLANAAMSKLGKPGPDGVKVLSLKDLSDHGFLEHDASLTRRDARKGDAVEVLPSLVEQMVSLSKDGKTLTLEDLTVAHQLRMAQSASDGHSVSIKADALGTFETAVLYKVLSRDGKIAIPDLIEFLQNERIPAHLTPQKLGHAALLGTAAVITALGNVPACEAAKRAHKAEQEIVEPAASRCPVANKASSAAG